MKGEFFVKIYLKKELKPDDVSEIKEIKCFNNIEDLLGFLHANRYELISVYTATCLLDWS